MRGGGENAGVDADVMVDADGRVGMRMAGWRHGRDRGRDHEGGRGEEEGGGGMIPGWVEGLSVHIPWVGWVFD